jgi:hypothetical protein
MHVELFRSKRVQETAFQGKMASTGGVLVHTYFHRCRPDESAPPLWMGVRIQRRPRRPAHDAAMPGLPRRTSRPGGGHIHDHLPDDPCDSGPNVA